MLSPAETLQEPPLSSRELNPNSLPALQPPQLHSYPQPSHMPYSSRSLCVLSHSWTVRSVLSTWSTGRAPIQPLGVSSNITCSMELFPKWLAAPSSVFPQPLVCASLVHKAY